MGLGGLVAVDWSLMTLALALVIVRLSLRRRRKTHGLAANLSDFFLVCSWVLGIVDISINTWKNCLRARYASWPSAELYYQIPSDQSAHLLKISWISLYFIYISLWLSKAAFIAFYYDIFFVHGSRTMRWSLYGISALAVLTFVLQMSLLTFWCNPISRNWNVAGKLCSAVHSITSVTVSTFANIITDLMIVSIPISAIAASRLRKIELVGIFFVLLMGSISIVAAVARFIVLKIVEHVPRSSITHTIDVCATIEIVASLAAVCMPSLRAFTRQRRPESTRSSSSKDSSTSSPLLQVSSSLGGGHPISPLTASRVVSISEQGRLSFPQVPQKILLSVDQSA